MQKTAVLRRKTIVDESGAVCRQIDAEIMKTARKRAYKLENGVENVTNMKNGFLGTEQAQKAERKINLRRERGTGLPFFRNRARNGIARA